MNTEPDDPLYQSFAASLRARGVGVYTVNSPQVKLNPQGGRWFHVLPLLRTGVRLILSDSDVVWLRDPRPYMVRLERAHPKMDFSISTDSQVMTDARRLASEAGAMAVKSLDAFADARSTLNGSDFDIEGYSLCGVSMNIGIMLFPPGPRAGEPRVGAVRAITEATEHLEMDNNLRKVDQGPINFRWKMGAGKHGEGGWRWDKKLHAVDDGSGARLCGLVNGSVISGILPVAQFCNMLTYGVLRYWQHTATRPYALHATWMRKQDLAYKLMRLREAKLVVDGPDWLTPDLLRTPRIEVGALPLHHIRLMDAQLRKLRSALFVSRLLGRALVLPTVYCTCEIGFWIKHVREDCKGSDHKGLELPYKCPIDHFLEPNALHTSPYAHRERSFIANPRTPEAVRRSTVRVRPCGGGAPAGAPTCETAADGGTIRLAVLPQALEGAASPGQGGISSQAGF